MEIGLMSYIVWGLIFVIAVAFGAYKAIKMLQSIDWDALP